MELMLFASPNRLSLRLLSAIVICLCPVVVFYALLFKQALAVPMYDDYPAILKFALGLHGFSSSGDRLLYCFATQYDEYKLVIEHLIVAADYGLTRHVHFGFLIATGNAMVLGLAGLLWRNSFVTERDISKRLLLFAPVLWFLFQLNYVENLDWAMCELQTVPVVLFSLATLHFAVRRGGCFALLASLCAIAAPLSSANGFLVIPIALWLLLRSRRFWSALSVAGGGLVAVAVFLYRYQRFDPSLSFPRPSVGTKLLFYCSFVGSAVENMHRRPIAYASLVLGVCILGVLLAFVSRQRRSDPFVLGVAVWCLLSAAVVTQGRSYLGVTMSLTGRYKVYSDLLLLCCYLLLVPAVSAGSYGHRIRERLWATSLVVSVLFGIAGDVNGYRFLAKRRGRVMLGLRQYLSDPGRTPPEISLGGEPFAGSDPQIARQLLTKALQLQMYRLPATVTDGIQR